MPATRRLPAETLVFDERRGFMGRPLNGVHASAPKSPVMVSVDPSKTGPIASAASAAPMDLTDGRTNMLAQLRRAGVEVDRVDLLTADMKARHPEETGQADPSPAQASMRRCLLTMGLGVAK
jgi:hypothetical protein